MSQSFDMAEARFQELKAQQSELLSRFVREDHAAGQVRLTEIVAGERCRDVYARLDETQKALEPYGATLTHRGKIGRNTPCPCGSSQKYKKCCVGRTTLVPSSSIG